MKERYKRNISSLSQEESDKLRDFKVCVVGCGGLGGYIIEMLARLGIGYITAVDYDKFEESNLNRQILSKESLLGNSKSKAAKDRVKEINSDVLVNIIDEKLSDINCLDIIKDHDIVVDALDSIKTRFILQEKCEELNIPLVHGAIGGWFGQVSTIFPGDNILDIVYKNNQDKGIENTLGNPSFIPANIASVQVSEVIKVLLNKGSILRNKLLIVDLLNNDYDIIKIK